MKKLLFIFLIFSFLGCATTVSSARKLETTPIWIEQPLKKYNAELYLSAVGFGDTKVAAEDNAIGNLARIFKSEIKAQQHISEHVSETASTIDKPSFDSKTDIFSHTNIFTTIELKNVKIMETYFDKEEGNYYALAAIDRLETADIYEQEFQTNTDRIYQLYTQFTKTEDLMLKMRYINTAVELSLKNNILNEQVRIISPMNQEIPIRGKSYNDLYAEKQSLLRSVRVEIGTLAGTDVRVKEYLVQSLSLMGFSVYDEIDTIANPDFRVIATLSVAHLNLERKEFFLQWNLSVMVYNSFLENTEVVFEKSGREGHTSQIGAHNRVMNAVRNTIKKDFPKFFSTTVLS